jgi:tetratricopeptide (TPR) repeat protein
MLSPKFLSNPNATINLDEVANFLALNQETWEFLLAFLTMSQGFKFAFAEINFPPDSDILVAALRSEPQCQEIQVVEMHFDSPDLLFFLDELQVAVKDIKQEVGKKLILIIKGLERAIGSHKDYPQVLTNLNYARDNFPAAVPYPLLFVLPDYAVTRWAQFAPDFWAWTASTFKFQTSERVLDWARQQTSERPDSNRTYAKSEQADRIDLLERLLQEYPEDDDATSLTRWEVLTQLAKAHQAIREFDDAIDYLQQALELSQQRDHQAQIADTILALGEVYYRDKKFDNAKFFLGQSLQLNESIGNQQNLAQINHVLGSVALELRQWEESHNYYHQSLEIKVEFDDRYSQASTYFQLGRLAEDQGDLEEANISFTKALTIFTEFQDDYYKSITANSLARIKDRTSPPNP